MQTWRPYLPVCIAPEVRPAKTARREGAAGGTTILHPQGKLRQRNLVYSYAWDTSFPLSFRR